MNAWMEKFEFSNKQNTKHLSLTIELQRQRFKKYCTMKHPEGIEHEIEFQSSKTFKH